MSRDLALLSWRDLMIDTGMRCDFLGTFNMFEAAYGEPHRRHHTIDHVDDCLDELCRARHLAENLNAIRLAIWFHDFIYDTHRDDNEARSARRAVSFCMNTGLDRFAVQVHHLIHATRHEWDPRILTPDTALTVDCDLAILGKDWSKFSLYESQIRHEFEWVPIEVFRRERAKILKRFLDRSSIFATEFFRDLYENQAQENLTRSREILLSAK